MSQAVQSHPRWTGHSEEFWQNVVYWRRKQQPTPVFLPQESHEQYEKAKIYDPGRWVPKVGRVQYANGEEQRAINNSSRKNEAAGPKWKWNTVVDISGGKSKVKVKSFSRVRLFATPWIVAHQAPPSMGFSRQEYWSGFPFPSPLESSRPRDRTLVSHIAGRCFNLWATREALVKVKSDAIKNNIA